MCFFWVCTEFSLSPEANVCSVVCLCVIGVFAGFGLHQVYAVNWSPAEAGVRQCTVSHCMLEAKHAVMRVKSQLENTQPSRPAFPAILGRCSQGTSDSLAPAMDG